MTNLGQGDCAWSGNIPRLYNYVPMVDFSGPIWKCQHSTSLTGTNIGTTVIDGYNSHSDYRVEYKYN